MRNPGEILKIPLVLLTETGHTLKTKLGLDSVLGAVRNLDAGKFRLKN